MRTITPAIGTRLYFNRPGIEARRRVNLLESIENKLWNSNHRIRTLSMSSSVVVGHVRLLYSYRIYMAIQPAYMASFSG